MKISDEVLETLCRRRQLSEVFDSSDNALASTLLLTVGSSPNALAAMDAIADELLNFRRGRSR